MESRIILTLIMEVNGSSFTNIILKISGVVKVIISIQYLIKAFSTLPN